jgi:hypothetical protein
MWCRAERSAGFAGLYGLIRLAKRQTQIFKTGAFKRSATPPCNDSVVFYGIRGLSSAGLQTICKHCSRRAGSLLYESELPISL